MAEYIDREDAIRKVMAAKWQDGMDGAMAMQIVAAAPAADVAPVRRGEWLKAIDNDCEMHQCDQCGARVVKGLYEYENPNRFCYHCGARMDERC